jgi:CHAD domain-containing protein
VRPLYGDLVEEPIRALTQLQDILGDHQDAGVAIDALRRMAGEERLGLPAETIFAMGELARHDAEESERLRLRFRRRWKRVQDRRWKKLWRAMDEMAGQAASPPDHGDASPAQSAPSLEERSPRWKST